MAWTERYVRADAAGGGDGTTDTNSGANGAWTFVEAVAAETAGMRINVKAGTYANTTNTRTLAAVGTTTQPIWWRGFDTAIGDLDDDVVTAKPLITFTTGRFTVTGAHHIMQNLDIIGAPTSGSMYGVSGAYTRSIRIRSEDTAAGASARAASTGTSGTQVFEACWFKANAAATSVCLSGQSTIWRDCVFEGGGHGVECTVGAATFSGCIFVDNGGDGITSSTTGSIQVDRCSFYSAGGDGIEFTVLPTAVSFSITNCIFANSAGYGINNSTGADTNTVFRANNSFYSNTSGTELGFGDSPSFHEQIESSSPFTNAGAGDFSLVAGALAKGNGSPRPGVFENRSFTSYLDIGAVQREEPAGGAGGGLRLAGHGGLAG